MNKYLTELLGASFLTLTLGGVLSGGAPGGLAPLAVGAMLTAMMGLAGPVSGGYLNPVLALAAWRTGRLPAGELAPYIVFQFLGGAAGATAVKLLKSGQAVAALQPPPGPAFAAEFVFTFALTVVVLSAGRVPGPAAACPHAASAGLVTLAGMVAVGGISPGTFNPAVTLGLMVLGAVGGKTLLVALLAQVGGAVAGVAWWRRLNRPEPS